MGICEEDAIALTGAIYDTVLDRTDLASVIGRLSAASGGHSALLRMVDCRRESESFVITKGYDDFWLQAYRDHFIHLDPYRQHLAASPPGELAVGEAFVPLRLRRQTELFNDYEKPQDRIHVVGANLGHAQDYLLYLGMHRGEAAGPYEDRDLDFIRSLLPHLHRAVQLKRLLDEAVEARCLNEALLERMRPGVILLDGAGALRFANAAARELAKLMSLRLGQSGIELPDAAANARLRKLLAQAARAPTPGTPATGGDLTIRHATNGNFQLRVFPIAQRGEPALSGRPVHVAIFLTRPGVPALSLRQIGAQWDLTAAEARLAAQLATSPSLKAAAREIGIAVSTARSQLNAVFAKTGAGRQAELVAMLLTSLAAFDGAPDAGER